MKPLLFPFQLTYGLICGIKNRLYDGEHVETMKIPAPVISVGNLSMGGTGKTPVVLSLSKMLARTFRRPVIVTRSYGSSLRSPVPVQLGQPRGAEFYGDEAFELAQKAAGLVYTGPTKWRTAVKAWEEVQPDILIVDDGFQHRRLHRDFDLVLIDATETKNELVPTGRLREPFQSLCRADAVVITKVNWATPTQLEQTRNRVRNALGKDSAIPVFEVGFHWADSTKIAELSFGRPVAQASAVGRNEILTQELEKVVGRPLDRVWQGRDHYPWSERDAGLLKQWLDEQPNGIIFTTEKDEVKFRPWMRNEKRLIPLIVEVDWAGQDAALMERILQQSGPVSRGLRPDFESRP